MAIRYLIVFETICNVIAFAGISVCLCSKYYENVLVLFYKHTCENIFYDHFHPSAALVNMGRQVKSLC